MSVLFLPALLLLVLFKGAGGTAAFFLALLVHEAAHLLMAAALSLRVEGMELLPFGCEAKVSGMLYVSAEKEFLVAAAGPVASLALSAVLMQMERTAFWEETYLLSTGLAAVNLLPVLPLDGGRMLYAIIVRGFGPVKAVKAAGLSGITASLLLLGLFTWLCVKGLVNYSLPLLMGFVLFSSVSWLFEAKTLSLEQRVKKRSAFLKEKILEVHALAAYQQCSAGQALMRMNPKKYNVVYVIDEDMDLICSLGEGKIQKLALEKGSGEPVKNAIWGRRRN